MHLTLRQAEQRVFASKSTILRAIKSGKLSAERDGPEGSYRIEPSELFRAFPPKSADTLPAIEPDATNRDPVAMVRIAVENEKLAALLEAEKRRADELRDERDSWKAQAERLALSHRATTAKDMAPTSPQEPASKPNFLERLGRALRG